MGDNPRVDPNGSWPWEWTQQSSSATGQLRRSWGLLRSKEKGGGIKQHSKGHTGGQRGSGVNLVCCAHEEPHHALQGLMRSANSPRHGGVSGTEGRPALLLTSRLPATALIAAGKEHCCSPCCEQP